MHLEQVFKWIKLSSFTECATFDNGINMCEYETHEKMIGKLQSLTKRYPNLAKVGTVGKSVQGRQLAYIKISANVTRRSRLEPMFKYVGKIRTKEHKESSNLISKTINLILEL